jgi:sucrose-6-phosphate hydrolase SacC (GH32 family)
MLAGCKSMCSDEMPPVMEKQGFKGAQSMPRQLNYDSVTKTLRAYPVKEMELLRGQQVSPLLVGLGRCCSCAALQPPVHPHLKVR